MSAAIELRPYQNEALSEFEKGVKVLGKNKQLIVLATGLGKTIIFAEAIRRVLERGKKALVIAHRDELLIQAEEKIRMVVGDSYRIGKEQGPYRSTSTDHVVLASAPTIGVAERESMGAPNQRLKQFNPREFGLVVIDEAHHSTSDTYRRIIDYFSGVTLLGVTATPKRSDEESLHGIFSRVAYKMDIVDGTKQGFLVPIVSHPVSSATDLSGIKTTAGDYNQRDLAQRVNNQARNSLISKVYSEKFLGRQCIVYATDLQHAFDLSEEFKALGVRVQKIDGAMDKDERRFSIQQFKNKEITVLTNFGVLTEGFDYPELDLIINARPTRSNLLLTQIAGRATRIFPGKKVADFVEIVDYHSELTATCAEIFGFDQKFNGEGHNFLECIKEAERMEKEKPFFQAFCWKSWSEMQKRFPVANDRNPEGSEYAQRQLELEDKRREERKKLEELRKQRVDAEKKARETLQEEARKREQANIERIKAEIEKEEKEIRIQKPEEKKTVEVDGSTWSNRYRWFIGRNGELKIRYSEKETEMVYNLIVREDPLGGFVGVVEATGRRYGDEFERSTVRGGTRLEAAKEFERWVLTKNPNWDRLLNLGAQWRKRPVSDKQWSLIQKLRLTNKDREDVCMDDASRLMDEYFSKNSNYRW